MQVKTTQQITYAKLSLTPAKYKKLMQNTTDEMWAYRFLRYCGNKDTTHGLLPVILKDPYISYLYAKDVIKGRWPDAEPNIMATPKSAALYLKYVVNAAQRKQLEKNTS